MTGFGRAVRFLVLSFLIFATTKPLSSYGYRNSNVLCIEMERDALLKFKEDIEDPSNRLSSWVGEVDCCKWDGVGCDNFTGHVNELRLANTQYVASLTLDDYTHITNFNRLEYFEKFHEWPYRSGKFKERESFENFKLKGKISDSILNLKYISYLDLSYNDFGGCEIPSFLGSLVNLNYLNLTGAGFQGLIPPQLGNLSKLHHLGLRGNSPYDARQLYTENLQWPQGLPSLLSLDLSYANLSKAFDWLLEVNTLSSLQELRLSYCELHYITPLSHVNFTSLSFLDISSNYFGSFIPEWISNLDGLVSLDLSANYFQGPLPRGFSNLTSLENLNMAHSYSTSLLPKWFFNLTTISYLDLHSNIFEGPIPCALQNMSTLAYLDLSHSRGFNSSTIPFCLYNLHNLQHLDLRGLNLQGEISYDIANMKNLVSLDLSYNNLQGRIPRSTGNLCNLEHISLAGNRFDGNLSEILENFSGCLMDSLNSLDLRRNKGITGDLTDQIAKFKKLQDLDLSYNNISGPIPESIGNLSSLKYFNVVGNSVNGTLPKSMGTLSSLESLIISGNFMKGIVSEVQFANLTNLRFLVMSGNSLTLSFHPEWVPPFNLWEIGLRDCNLGPQFPKWLKSQSNFGIIDISNAGISDAIPNWFWNLSTAYLYMDLSHNQISGRVPDFRVSTQSAVIILGSNNFHGRLPSISSGVAGLDLSNNSISGNIVDFLCHSKSQNNGLNYLQIGNNLLSGNITDCWVNWRSLRILNLENNNLYGKLPSSMGSLSQLVALRLGNNKLFGEIPQFLKNWPNLRALDLSENAFNGSIPEWMGTSLPNLQALLLRSNGFGGNLPNELCGLTNLKIMDIGHNKLEGPIPHCFGNLTAMTRDSFLWYMYQTVYLVHYYTLDYLAVLETVQLTTKGRNSLYNTILPLVNSMDLSDNRLSGEIPPEITNLFKLKFLNLSRNHLRGAIPENIGNMTSLESLDLSGNRLSGKIPQSITKLTFLNELNLSYNDLSGPIPTSTQLQSFDPSDFVGNHLCGLPLTKNCKTEGTTTSEDALNEGDGNLFDKWFYLSVIAGIVVGFWGIWAPLLLSTSWRHKYYRRLDSMCHNFKYKMGCL